MKKRFALFFLACFVLVALAIAAVVCSLIAVQVSAEGSKVDMMQLLIEFDLVAAFVVGGIITALTRIVRR